ncbi:MAG: AEC family transporter [Gammaproteobacteria bacterium]|nr:AEC family transporter [Gammaproteobacteria bacterium]MDH3506399.1 AEC family transporter [Gammaproteobacteria bacterium]
MIEVLAGILLPVFIVAGIGFGWARLGLPLDRGFVSRLVINVATPCLILDSVSKLGLPLSEFTTMLASALIMYAAAALGASLVLRLAGLPQRSFLPSMTFGNAGNIGLPLSYFAFGDEGLGLSSGVFLVAVVLQFTLAPALQDGRPALKTLATTPVVYGSALGVALLATGTALPSWLDRTVGLLADIAIPLALLTLGFALAEFRIRRASIAISLGLGRLVLGFSVALGVSELLGLTGVARSVLILTGSMPTAVVCYLLAERYGCDPDDVAGVVLVSTLTAAFLLPLLVAYALWLEGSLPI